MWAPRCTHWGQSPQHVWPLLVTPSNPVVMSVASGCPMGCSDLPWGAALIPHSLQTSVLCKAAVHAGVIADELGGQVTLSREKGITLYESSFANGLHSKRWVRSAWGCTPCGAVGPTGTDAGTLPPLRFRDPKVCSLHPCFSPHRGSLSEKRLVFHKGIFFPFTLKLRHGFGRQTWRHPRVPSWGFWVPSVLSPVPSL